MGRKEGGVGAVGLALAVARHGVLDAFVFRPESRWFSLSGRDESGADEVTAERGGPLRHRERCRGQ